MSDQIRPRHDAIKPTKFWRDVESAALDNNILHYVVSIVERGDLTREEALIHGHSGVC